MNAVCDFDMLVSNALEGIKERNVIKERKYEKLISIQLRQDYQLCSLPNRIKRGKSISPMVYALPSPNKNLDSDQERLICSILFELGFDDEYAYKHIHADYRYVYKTIKQCLDEDNTPLAS